LKGTVSASIFIGQRSNDTQEYCSNITVERNIIRNAQDYELETPIRIDVVENVEVFYNYLEGFASHSEEYGIHFEISPKGVINIHDNIIAFGTLANEASGSHIDYGVTTTPTINYHHNTFFNLTADLNGDTDSVSHTFIDNLSYQCTYYDETGSANFIGDPSFIDGNPIKQTQMSVPTLHDFDSYYNQLINPFRLVAGSLADGYGYRFDLASSTDDTTKPSFEIYPNPATNYITINTDKKVGNISIYNQLGQMVLTKTIIDDKLNITRLKNGIYFVILEINGFNTSQKLIVSR
jgi:hypothetical protein